MCLVFSYPIVPSPTQEQSQLALCTPIPFVQQEHCTCNDQQQMAEHTELHNTLVTLANKAQTAFSPHKRPRPCQQSQSCIQCKTNRA